MSCLIVKTEKLNDSQVYTTTIQGLSLEQKRELSSLIQSEEFVHYLPEQLGLYQDLDQDPWRSIAEPQLVLTLTMRLGTQSFTSLVANLRQDISKGF